MNKKERIELQREQKRIHRENIEVQKQQKELHKEDMSVQGTGWEEHMIEQEPKKKEIEIEVDTSKPCPRCKCIHRKITFSKEKPELGFTWRTFKCLECGQHYVVRDIYIAKNPEAYEKLREIEISKQDEL